MRNYFRLIQFVRPYVGTLSLAFVLMFISAHLTISAPALLGSTLIDRILTDKKIVFDIHSRVPTFLQDQVSGLLMKVNSIPRMDLLRDLVIIAIILYLLKGIFIFCQSYLMSRVSQGVVRDLRCLIYSKLIRLSLDFFSRNRVGALVSRVTYDTTIIQEAVSEGLTDLVFRFFELLVCMSMLVFIKIKTGIPWNLILLSLVIFPITIYPVAIIGRRLRQISRKSQEKMADINTMLYESISGIRVAQAYTTEDYEIGRFRKNLDQYFRIMMKSVKRIIFVGPMSEFVGMCCSAVVLWWGGKMVIGGRLTPGDFIFFLLAFAASFHPISRLSRIHVINQQALAAATRIFDILDTPVQIADPPDAIVLPPFSREIVFRDVNFKYDQSYVLKEINLAIRKGDVVALVGPSGVGKSTMVNLILRFYDPTEGAVEIDGCDLRRVTLPSLRRQIGIVTQETILFNDTVRANIAYGNPDAPLEEVMEAGRIANAHEFISAMPEGYDTLIGDRGFRLSGGEKQRLAIARAVLKNPPILILDEATSQLDAASEMVVQEAIERLMTDRTVLVIAHRLSTIRRANVIVVLEKGKIVGSGSHQKLYAESELYRKICQMQITT